MLHTGRPTGRVDVPVQKSQTWAPPRLISSPPSPHARTHGERSPPREGTAAAPPLPTAGGQGSRTGCAAAPSRLPPDTDVTAPHCERREGASLLAAGGTPAVSGRRVCPHFP
jgi:hypothetical protein